MNKTYSGRDYRAYIYRTQGTECIVIGIVAQYSNRIQSTECIVIGFIGCRVHIVKEYRVQNVQYRGLYDIHSNRIQGTEYTVIGIVEHIYSNSIQAT